MILILINFLFGGEGSSSEFSEVKGVFCVGFFYINKINIKYTMFQLNSFKWEKTMWYKFEPCLYCRPDERV